MSKETILKEFMNLKFENKQHFGRCSDGEMIFKKVFEPLLSKAITQTREETIREVLELVRDLDIFGYPAITKEEYKEMLNDILNKLKK